MKKILFSITAIVFTALSFAQKKADDVAKFTTETIDLGNITQNQPSTAVFEVTNIGTEPLIIETANPTCGCTISDFTKTPIEPGKTGTIKATYNAKNLNAFEKHLTVKFAGADDLKSITIKGNVIVAETVPATDDKAETAPVQTEKASESKAAVQKSNTENKKSSKSKSSGNKKPQ